MQTLRGACQRTSCVTFAQLLAIFGLPPQCVRPANARFLSFHHWGAQRFKLNRLEHRADYVATLCNVLRLRADQQDPARQTSKRKRKLVAEEVRKRQYARHAPTIWQMSGQLPNGSLPAPYIIATALFAQLSAADQKLALQGKMEELVAALTQYGKRRGVPGVNGKCNPFHGAVDLLNASPPSAAWKKGAAWRNKKQTILRWVQAVWGEGRMSDKPRSPAEKVTAEPWLLFKDALTSYDFTWLDRNGNTRRHPTLAHWRDVTQRKLDKLLKGSAAEQEDDADDIAKYYSHLLALAQVLAETKWNIATLLRKTAEMFALTKKKEKFKPTRPKTSAQRLAQMMRGHLPLVEMLYSLKHIKQTEEGNARPVPTHKVIKTTVQQPRYAAAHSGRTAKYAPLYFDEGAFHITANIDGASVFVDGDINYDANMVYYDVRLPQIAAACPCAVMLHTIRPVVADAARPIVVHTLQLPASERC